MLSAHNRVAPVAHGEHPDMEEGLAQMRPSSVWAVGEAVETGEEGQDALEEEMEEVVVVEEEAGAVVVEGEEEESDRGEVLGYLGSTRLSVGSGRSNEVQKDQSGSFHSCITA